MNPSHAEQLPLTAPAPGADARRTAPARPDGTGAAPLAGRALEVLRDTFGHPAFRGAQADIVLHVLVPLVASAFGIS